MRCPCCVDNLLQVIHGCYGNVLDGCTKCRGIWLDQGEIYLFSLAPARLQKAMVASTPLLAASARLCPRCQITMNRHAFLQRDIEIEICQSCQGMWFDEGELAKARRIDKKLFGCEPLATPNTKADKSRPRNKFTLGRFHHLPSLGLRSATTLVLLGGTILLGLIIAAELNLITIKTAVISAFGFTLLQFLISPFLLDVSMQLFHSMRWVQVTTLPSELQDFLAKLAKDNKTPSTRFGLIDDGTPQIFTYGHVPSNMRIVFSRGILDILDKEELKTVFAHEIAHGKHWDLAIMSMAQTIPIILYSIYRALVRMKFNKSDETGGHRLAIGAVAYLLYLISEYLVLGLSRVREYHADAYAAAVTRNPKALANALVKIAYGLAAQVQPADPHADKLPAAIERDLAPSRAQGQLDPIGGLGIFDSKTARTLVMATISDNGSGPGPIADHSGIKDAMKWDLWNPWASWYELHSTHPLIAKRLLSLSKIAKKLGLEPVVEFDLKKPESYWDEFLLDLGIVALPVILPLATFMLMLFRNQRLAEHGPMIQSARQVGMLIFAFAIGALINLRCTYRGRVFPQMTVRALLHRIKVSPVRPVACSMRGTIIGRGIPGLIWSEDFILRDKSGLIFLDYRHPLAIWEMFFGLLKSKQYQDQEVEVTGWLRRAPQPYLEIRTLRSTESTKTLTSRVPKLKFALALLLIAIGTYLIVFPTLSGKF